MGLTNKGTRGIRISMSGMTNITCPVCGEVCEKPNSAVNRAQRSGAPIYCGKECSGVARRSGRSVAERRLAKAEYDRKYRAENKATLKKKKAAYFQRTYDPDKAAVERANIKSERPHIEAARREYMSSDGYRAKKKKYDRRYNAIRNYGPEWGDCMVLALEVRDMCLSRMSDYEIRLENGTLSKSQKRKREYERLNSKEPKGCPLGHIK